MLTKQRTLILLEAVLTQLDPSQIPNFVILCCEFAGYFLKLTFNNIWIIQGARAASRNLSSKLHKLDQESLKQQEIIYMQVCSKDSTNKTVLLSL